MNIDEIIQQPGQKERALKRDIMRSLHVAVPGEVVSFNAANRTVVVQPVIRDWDSKDDPPLLTDVPVFFIGNYTFTPQKGDGCLVVFADSCIDAWLQSGKGVSTPLVSRNHSLSDGFAFVGFNQTGGTPMGAFTFVKAHVTLYADDWTEEDDLWTATFYSSLVTSTSTEIVNMGDSVDLSAKNVSELYFKKKSGGGGIVFYSNERPTGSISGIAYILYGEDGGTQDGMKFKLPTSSPSRNEFDDLKDQFGNYIPNRGSNGQLLKSNGDGTAEWTSAGTPTEAQVETAVNNWLVAHPEATTTVQDGAISRAKLNDDLKQKTDAVADLEQAYADIPEGRDSTATGIDLDISDTQGNVIVRFKDGHVKTKEFDSSELDEKLDEKQDALTFDDVPTQNSENPVKSGGVYNAIQNADNGMLRDSTKLGVDLDVSDGNGRVILRLEGGHVKTKEFDSSELAEKFSEKQDVLTFDEEPTEDSDNPVTSGGVYSALQDVDIDIIRDSSKTGVDLDFSDESGNVILRLEDGHIQTKNFDSRDTDSGMVKESNKQGVDLDISDQFGNVILRLANGNIYTKNFDSTQEEGTKILTVKSSGGDYTSIRAAVEAAATAGASADNPYIIQIDPGSYDILSYFTAEEIAEEGFCGLMLTDGITLEGMGVLREQTVLYAEMDTTTYDLQKRGDVSTLNFRGNVGIKNLTVKSKNMRYGIHDDFSFSSTKPKVRRITNCNIYAEATTSWNTGNVSYGAGTDGNKVFIFEDCDLNDTILIHTDIGSYPNLAILRNCKGFQFLCKDYAAQTDSQIFLYGCDFKWVREDKTNNWTTQHLFMYGDLKGAMVEGWEGIQYNLGDSYKVQQSPVTAAPRAVTSATTGRYHIQTTSNAYQVTGVLYYYDQTDGFSLVQSGGWMCAELLGFTSPTVGQYLVVGSGGVLSLSNSDTNAIGRVVFENEIGSHFIKLSI